MLMHAAVRTRVAAARRSVVPALLGAPTLRRAPTAFHVWRVSPPAPCHVPRPEFGLRALLAISLSVGSVGGRDRAPTGPLRPPIRASGGGGGGGEGPIGGPGWARTVAGGAYGRMRWWLSVGDRRHAKEAALHFDAGRSGQRATSALTTRRRHGRSYPGARVRWDALRGSRILPTPNQLLPTVRRRSLRKRVARLDLSISNLDAVTAGTVPVEGADHSGPSWP
jgi:hypothetical protein